MISLRAFTEARTIDFFEESWLRDAGWDRPVGPDTR